MFNNPPNLTDPSGQLPPEYCIKYVLEPGKFKCSKKPITEQRKCMEQVYDDYFYCLSNPEPPSRPPDDEIPVGPPPPGVGGKLPVPNVCPNLPPVIAPLPIVIPIAVNLRDTD